jgi:hypothetical protein
VKVPVAVSSMTFEPTKAKENGKSGENKTRILLALGRVCELHREVQIGLGGLTEGRTRAGGAPAELRSCGGAEQKEEEDLRSRGAAEQEEEHLRSCGAERSRRRRRSACRAAAAAAAAEQERVESRGGG